MDPIRLIKQDHRRVKVLFRRIEQAKSKSERQKIGQEIIEELSVHAAIEEQLIYPMLRHAEGKRAVQNVLNALEEHHAMKMVLAELDKMDASDERYLAKFHVVREATESHIEEEEKKLLPALSRLLDAERSRDLADAMRMMKAAAPNHPHPMAPDEPPGNVVAAMLAKMSDTGKDLLRKLTSSNKAAGHARVTRRAQAQVAAVRRARTA